MRQVVSIALLGAALCACGGNGEAPRASRPEPTPEPAAATAPETPEPGKTFELPAGRAGVPPVRIQVVARGEGKAARTGDSVVVHYIGTLTDGNQFDSSRESDDPYVFRIGAHDVIDGWDLIVAHMHVGDRWIATIPYQLAYGEGGRMPLIPPRADLVFDMELLAVR